MKYLLFRYIDVLFALQDGLGQRFLGMESKNAFLHPDDSESIPKLSFAFHGNSLLISGLDTLLATEGKWGGRVISD